jgi:CheY-like chemotaxis protein
MEKQLKVLLVEDEFLIQQSLKKLMERKGAQVDATASGTEAIEMIKNSDYQKIVCDLMLNDVSGFDVIEESKKFLSSDEISERFTIITAYSSSHILEKAEKYNCKVLTKPFKNINEAIELFLS